jgi:hypothetical protein
METINKFITARFKIVLGIALVLSLAIYAHNAFSTTRAGSDQLYQLGAAVNYLEENGFSLLSSYDFENIERKTLDKWPRFYLVLAVPVLALTGKNVELSFLLIRVMSFLVFLLSFLYVIKNLDLRFKESISVLAGPILAILLVPVNYGGAADIFAISATLVSVVVLYRYWYENQSIKYVLLYFLLIALLPQIRYAYVPIAIAMIFFFLLVHFFVEKKLQNQWHYLFVVLPICSLIYILSSSYFVQKSNKYLEAKTELPGLIENSIVWLKPFYAPFFNSFFPDYILLNFLSRFGFYDKVVLYTFALFILISLIILFALVKNYLSKIKGLKSLFAKGKFIETSLFFIIAANIAVYILIYRNSNFMLEDIQSGLIFKRSLAVANRYFVPIHVSVFLLAIIYIVNENSNILKSVLFASVLFGCLHYTYLRVIVYSPFDRAQNMDIVNLPEGSYNDMVAMSDIMRSYKIDGKVYFFSNVDSNNENFRQIKPGHFAVANGLIRVPKDDLRIDKCNSSDKCILLQSISNTEDLSRDEWGLEYKGQIYSLYKYKL